MDWNDVRYFLALARSGSVRAAGASLGVSHSTVARRVEALEAQLATRLFDRSRDGYALSDAGRRMVPTAERIEGEMAALERELVGTDERLAGSVAVTCCDHYVADILLEALAGFCGRCPDVRLRFMADSRPYDLSKREADVAVRTLGTAQSPPEHLIGVRLAPVVIANYVATVHADRLDPAHPGSEPVWAGNTDAGISRALVAGSSYPDVPIRDGFSTLELMVRAALHGFGLVMLPTYVGDRAAGLQRLSQPDLRPLGQLWLLSHVDLRDNARFRAARTCIREAMAAARPLFEGEWPSGAPERPGDAPGQPTS